MITSPSYWLLPAIPHITLRIENLVKKDNRTRKRKRKKKEKRKESSLLQSTHGMEYFTQETESTPRLTAHLHDAGAWLVGIS